MSSLLLGRFNQFVDVAVPDNGNPAQASGIRTRRPQNPRLREDR